jgi:hypothetical protein
MVQQNKLSATLLSVVIYVLLCWMPLCWVSWFMYCHVECHYAECHAECHYAECRGALWIPLVIFIYFLSLIWMSEACLLIFEVRLSRAAVWPNLELIPSLHNILEIPYLSLLSLLSISLSYSKTKTWHIVVIRHKYLQSSKIRATAGIWKWLGANALISKKLYLKATILL